MSGLFDTSTVIAFGLIGIVVVIYLIDRIKVLPRKTLPFVAAALAGVFGIALFKGYRSSKAAEKARKLEAEIAQREKRLKELETGLGASVQQLTGALADLDSSIAAEQKEALRIRAANKAEQDRIDRLSPAETFDEFRRMFKQP